MNYDDLNWCGLPEHGFQGGSHWHCGNCDQPSGMYGHKVNGAWECEPKETPS